MTFQRERLINRIISDDNDVSTDLSMATNIPLWWVILIMAEAIHTWD